MSAVVLALVAGGGGLVAWTAWREKRRAIARRCAMLDGCAALFDDGALTVAPDGFPRLSGTLGSRRLAVSLVPDTLAPKRLPQLWLVVSLSSPRAMPHLAVTARPRGDDFISAATDMRRHVPVPPWLPTDCAVRGDDGMADLWMTKLRASLEAAFADPRLKEIALGPSGMRLVYQAGEGRRGAHLLLRQARFETAIDRSLVQSCVSILRDLAAAAAQHDRQRAAA